MRTIKFRGKSSCKDKKWLYGDLIETYYDYHILEKGDMIEDGHRVVQDRDRPTWVDAETVGQFTGLLDKNGKEIYEGDIVKFTKWNGELTTGLVKLDDCNPCMCIEYKTEYKQTDWEYDFIKCGTMKIEVIGNIHDNPELLKD